MVSITRRAPKQILGERWKAARELAALRNEIQEPVPEGMQVVDILQQLNVDEGPLIAALLADRRCADITSEVIAAKLGDDVATLVQNVRLLNNFRPCREDQRGMPQQAEGLRRLLLAITNDVRAVLIKLAYRLAHLRLLKQEPEALRRCLAQETLDIFAPLANRLGVAQVKWEMEDLAFRHLNPQAYKQIAVGLEERRSDREQYVEDFKSGLIKLLQGSKIEVDIQGRPKHIYSIWKKMQRKHVGLDQLFDIRALRVIVADVGACYAALGLVHTHWKTIPKEFDDYIANPKPNGYQSLHTVVIGPEHKPIEIQIRTRAMDSFAELGFAAHWRYKEGSEQDDALNNVIISLRSLLDDSEGDTELIEDFRSELFPDRVFVLTPNGDVVELATGGTSLDFAYAVHTEVGHRCRGAKVDGRIVPLTRPLVTGEQVEILTAREAQPRRDWMNPGCGFLVSPSARAKVRHWFHLRDRSENLEAGERIVEHTIKRLGSKKLPLETLLKRFNQDDEDALYVAIGRGDIRQTQLDVLFKPKVEKRSFQNLPSTKAPARALDAHAEVLGVSNLLTKIAQCCKPVPGDEVVGYITLGQGVTIHRRDCSNLFNLPEPRRERLIEIQWGGEQKFYTVELKITAFDRPGLLNDITKLLLDQQANLLGTHSRTNPDTQDVKMNLSLQVRHYEQLTTLINRIEQVQNVFEVRRIAS